MRTCAEGPPELRSLGLPAEECGVGAEDGCGFLGRFLEQLDAEVSQTCGTEFRKVAGTGLGDGIEEGVAAADIGAERMLHPNAITQMDAVCLARASAVGMILALREEGSKDAVLHMKHRHVLVKGELKPLRRSRPKEIKHLTNIQIIANGDAFESPPIIHIPLHEELGGKGIGNIQRKITDRSELRFLKVGDGSEVANEDAVGGGIGDQLEESLLGSLLDPRGGKQDDGGSIRRMRADKGDGILVPADILEVGVELADPDIKGRPELLHGAAEDTENGITSLRSDR